jgi:hypothetical protein
MREGGLQRIVRRRLSLIRQPILIVQGRLDGAVHPGVPDMLSMLLNPQCGGERKPSVAALRKTAGSSGDKCGLITSQVQMERLINGLLQNSQPEGGVIHIAAMIENQETMSENDFTNRKAKIIIQDNGCGIPKEIQKRYGKFDLVHVNVTYPLGVIAVI